MNKEIEKLVKKGDLIYSAANGKAMEILEMDEEAIYTSEDVFYYDEVGKTFFLHPKSFELKRKRK